jgi:hypothetical protein
VRRATSPGSANGGAICTTRRAACFAPGSAQAKRCDGSGFRGDTGGGLMRTASNEHDSRISSTRRFAGASLPPVHPETQRDQFPACVLERLHRD